MPRLLRVHFASIGHRDARLSPLTIDLRGQDQQATDSVLWLRNGGGKSSIINLFFSIFRPHRNEFLGAAAEGKARRIEHYVKGKDLAFAITEWDLGADATGRTRTCVVGRVLSWKGQIQSSDPSKLRRLFFTFSSSLPGADELGFDKLPVLGLGEPTPTYDAFRDWLSERASCAPAAQVVYTENQRQWNQHLERLGLDPELFRYQIRMNLREGAADEAFRFGTTLEFVHFLLELAFDTGHADQIAKNLEKLRDQFARRPTLELERAFIVEALAALNPLVAAVRERERGHDALAQSLDELGALTRGLSQHAEASSTASSTRAEAAERATQHARTASNERDKRSRWARGLAHLGSELDVQQKRARACELEDRCQEVADELRLLRAAEVRRDLDRLEAELADLRESLRRAEAKLAPERNRLELAGGALHAALGREIDRLGGVLDDLADRTGVARSTCDKKQARIDELRAEIARLRERVSSLSQTVRRRETAREKLQKLGWIELREDASAALERWQAALERSTERREQLKRRHLELQERLDSNRDRQQTVAGELARFEEQYASADQAVSAALEWRQRLAQNACVIELEAVDEPDLESPGLEQRLRDEAAAAASAILEARVDGAEDERALSGIQSGGLLPPSRDVERVTEALRAQSLNAHSGAAFLAETVAQSDRRARLLSDPARFGGVLVSTAALPDKIADATRGLDLRTPVQVSAIGPDQPQQPERSTSVHVVPPNPASYDHSRADEIRVTLEDRRAARERRAAELRARRRDYETSADELQRYLAAHGRGRLDALEQARAAAAEQAAMAREERSSLGRQTQALQDDILELSTEAEQCAAQLSRAERATTTLQLFWDEHEATIDATRAALEASNKQIRDAERELSTRALSELEQAKGRLEELVDQSKDRKRDQAELEGQSAVIEYRTATEPVEPMALLQARDRYQHLLTEWQQRTSDSKLQWQMDETAKRATPLRKEFSKLVAGLDRALIGELATEADLEERLPAAELRQSELRERRADAKALLSTAGDVLSESARRRDARDLPPESEEHPRPKNSAAARAAAEEMRLAAQSYVEAAREADERAQVAHGESTRLALSSERYRSLAAKLAALVEGAGLALPERLPASLPDTVEAADASLKDARSRFTDARSRLLSAEDAVRKQADAVRIVATAAKFSELRSQARERMNADTDELTGDCERVATKLTPRLEVIDAHLEELHKDRQILVDALQTVGAEAGRLLHRAQGASTLPNTLGAWSGKPYLRMSFQFPDSDEERRARLEPLVDSLVQKAHIPNGLELVKLAVAHLAGARGFTAKVLKPDAVLRPDQISITAMNTFSRGQQLTAAILLYCTLVQLRARSRGRGTGPTDAGILVLDNPIGTCSSVPLLELQRTIAKEMRVQLIYATGVDDLEALETLPNKIRLRNSMRDRRSGDFHVTQESHLEAVRVTSIEP